VQAGEVFGFLGPNGAGKSPTIRTMLDFIRPNDGRITLFGLDSRTEGPAIHARVGYVPGEFGLYERLTAEEYLRDFAAFRGDIPWARIAALTERFQLELHPKIRNLSHGNRRKIALIQAFMHEPDLLVMDEPTQGLDPLMQQEFFALIDDVSERGVTVFLSSHVMPEVERLCDRVAIIREGRLITVSDVGELKANALRTLTLHFDRPVGTGPFATLASVLRAEAHGDTVRLTIKGTVDEVLKEAARHTVVNIASEEPSLEDAFLEIYRNGGDGGDGGDGGGGDHA